MTDHNAALHPSQEWINTAWGRALPVAGVTPDDLDIRGLAEVLGKLPRWNGHTPGILVSVADHSVWVSEVAEDLARDRFPDDEAVRQVALAGLLHDGHESLICDRPTPVKIWERWRADGIDTAGELASRFDAALFALAGLPWPLPAEWAALVRLADLTALATEKRDFTISARPWGDTLPPPLPRRLTPSHHWSHAQEAFLARWTALTGRHG